MPQRKHINHAEEDRVATVLALVQITGEALEEYWMNHFSGDDSHGGWHGDEELQVRGNGEEGEETVQGDCDGGGGQA